MFTFRAKIFTVVSLVLVLIIGLVVWALTRPKIAAPVVETSVVKQQANLPATSVSSVVPEVKPATAEELSALEREVMLKNQARNFVEKFGSWSVLANFSNFDELKSEVTEKVAKWLDGYKAQILAEQGKDFVGVTTQAVTQQVLKNSADSAQVLVSAQREETYASGNKRYIRDMIVELVWVGGKWVVSGAYWQ